MTNWKTKAMRATAGSRFGAVLAAALGETIPAPCFHGRASVTSDGFVMATFTDSDGRRHMGAFVGSIDDVVRNTLGLAAHLRLNAADRNDLYGTVRTWVAVDYSGGRALAGLKITVH